VIVPCKLLMIGKKRRFICFSVVVVVVVVVVVLLLSDELTRRKLDLLLLLEGRLAFVSETDGNGWISDTKIKWIWVLLG